MFYVLSMYAEVFLMQIDCLIKLPYNISSLASSIVTNTYHGVGYILEMKE
jgi:hypothetical protein